MGSNSSSVAPPSPCTHPSSSPTQLYPDNPLSTFSLILIMKGKILCFSIKNQAKTPAYIRFPSWMVMRQLQSHPDGASLLPLCPSSTHTSGTWPSPALPPQPLPGPLNRMLEPMPPEGVFHLWIPWSETQGSPHIITSWSYWELA